MTGPGPAGDGAGALVRELRTLDLPRILALEQQLFGPSAWNEAMVREELGAPGRWYVGVDGEELVRGTPPLVPSSRLVAYAGLWFDGDDAHVMTVGVAPGSQRRGLGSLLMRALVERARSLGAASVLLEVRVDNEPAIALYERLGFAVLGRRRRYYQPEDVDAFTMRLPL